MISRLLGALWLFCLLNHYAFAQSSTTGLPLKDPAASGFQSADLAALGNRMADSIPALGSLLVWSNGGIVYEKYFHGASATTAFNIKSITKSVVSAIAGVAQSKNLLPDLNTPVLSFFPEFSKPHGHSSGVWFAEDKQREDAMRKKQTLEHLLTMQAGWEWNDFGPVVSIFINAADPVRFTMDLPFATTPGTQFVYCSAASSVFSAALQKAVKADLKSFAEKYLFAPAGMKLDHWYTDPVGRWVGASEMHMTSRDLLRFGLLYLNRGKVGGRQLLPESWIKTSLAEHAKLDQWDILPGANGYGYYWWRRKTNGYQAYIASGAMGQIITVIPELDMVVVANCLLSSANRGREEIRRIHEFVNELTAQKQRSLAAVKVEQGLVSGSINSTGDVRTYKGLPYAAPPVGKLRWKEPQGPTAWSGVRPCINFGPNAMQPEPKPSGAYGEEIMIPKDGAINEDCLYLNIWTPAKSANEKRPVLVVVHGGGFMAGSGSIPLLDGEQMAKKGLVVVSINYRLGVFGFLAHPLLSAESPHHSSGNYGILDQMAAFRWIKKNIAAFGGDPNNITADGGSAGSCSVVTILASELGKGLFNKVISESGPLFQPNECRELKSAEQEGQQTMKQKNAMTLEQMRALPAEELLKGDHLQLPVVDGYVLKEHIRTIFAKGGQNDVNLLIGYNEGDHNMYGPALSAKAFTEQVRQQYEDLASLFLQYYPAGTNEEAARSQVLFTRDKVFGWGNYLWAKGQWRNGQNKVWYYYYSQPAPAAPGEPSYCAFHGCQGAYALHNLHRWNLPFTEWDRKLSDMMSDYWVNFAATGDPNRSPLPIWPPFSPSNTKVLEFGKEIKVIDLPAMRVFQFFEKESVD